MSILTIFSAPKPFTDPHIALIQRNAIRSWQALGKNVDVILVGDEAGLAETAKELNVRQLSGVRRNEQGTPLVSHIFELAREAGSTPLMAYVNADVLLTPDLLDAALYVAAQTPRFLLVGQRWDLDVKQPLYLGPGWEDRLRADVQARGRLHPAGGSDYFVYPSYCFTHLPDFAIGRAGWDNWMIYEARRQGWIVIDATQSVMVVHQEHDYSHLPEGRSHYTQEESDRNRSLAGGKAHMYILLDANKRLVHGNLERPAWSLPLLIRRLEVLLMPEGQELTSPRWNLVWRLRRMRMSIEKGKQ